MSDADLFRVVELPYAQAVMLEAWNAPPGRFFVGYRARHGFSALLGGAVVDEFKTISAPILLAPAVVLGGVYDAGMQIAELRDVEAPIDSGWPPLTIGIEVEAPDMAADWQIEFLGAMQDANSRGSAPWRNRRRQARIDNGSIDNVSIDILQCLTDEQPFVTIIVTSARLLPAQLERLADMDTAPLTVAVSSGNRLPYIETGERHTVTALSEAQLRELTAGVHELLSELREA
jgi:hypothetical protein